MGLRVALTHVYAWPEVRRGAERYLHELGAALLDAGHEVTILSTAAAPGTTSIHGVPVRFLHRRHLLRRRFGALSDEVAFGAAALAVLGRRRRLDVWHAMGTADAAAAAWLGRLRDVRSVYTDHGFPNRASRARRPDHRLHDAVVRHVDEYVCVSDAAGRYLRDGYGREPVVLSGGVDTRRFAPAAGREPHPTLLFAGDADERRKNLPLLLEALALLVGDRPGTRLWIAGPGDQEAAVAAAPAAARDAAECLGAVDPDSMADLYGRAWVTVLPAVAEAFGLALVESLACGTPIVALDEGGGPTEIVRPGIGFTAAAEARSLADACAAAIELAGEADAVDRCRAAAAEWDWRTSIVPRLEAVYGR